MNTSISDAQAREYDQIVSAAMEYFIKQPYMVLKEFDPTDKRCLFAFDICCMVQQFFKRKLFVDLPLFKYLLFKFKNKGKVRMKRVSNIPNEYGNVIEILDEIVKPFEVNTWICNDIYEAYYERKDIC